MGLILRAPLGHVPGLMLGQVERPDAQSLMPPSCEPIGVVLAGGLGRRIGGSKALVELAGRPLISYPYAALKATLSQVAVIAKPDTALPSLAEAAVWIEPAAPRHPLVGLVHAIILAAGRPVLACAADLPFVTPELVARLAEADPHGAPAVIAAGAGSVQPLLGCYQPRCADLLGYRAGGPLPPLREAVAAIAPRVLEVADPDLLFNVNSRGDLLQAAAMLEHRRCRAAIRT